MNINTSTSNSKKKSWHKDWHKTDNKKTKPNTMRVKNCQNSTTAKDINNCVLAKPNAITTMPYCTFVRVTSISLPVLCIFTQCIDTSSCKVCNSHVYMCGL